MDLLMNLISVADIMADVTKHQDSKRSSLAVSQYASLGSCLSFNFSAGDYNR